MENMLISYLCFGIIFVVSGASGDSKFVPEIQMPYLKIPGTSTEEMDMIGSTLTCDQQRNSLKDCATECYDSGCPGFYTQTTQNDVCHLCHVSDTDEIQASLQTGFNYQSILSLLKEKAVIPEVSMSFNDHSGNTITGTGTTGTTTNVQESDYVSGIKNQALYLHDGGKVQLTGSQTQCWTNLQHCASGMTASIWFKPLALQLSRIVGAGHSGMEGFQLNLAQLDGIWKFNFVININNGHDQRKTTNAISTNQWYHLLGVYGGGSDLKFYVNGIEQTQADDGPRSLAQQNGIAHIGVKHKSPYNTDYAVGHVDEFKFFSIQLTSADAWREYVGYDLDLIRPDIIVNPDLVSNGNDYNELLDGNLAACVTAADSCKDAFKVKLWNSAVDKTNYSVTITTENINCGHTGFNGLMVYGNQGNVPNNLIGGNEEERQHFLGNFDMLNLKGESQANGQTECVFKHMCGEGNICYYVFVSAQNEGEEISSKICEIQFN